MGAINEAGMNFLGDLGRRITKHTDDHRESAFLFLRLRNDLYCVEWDVKLYYTIPYLSFPTHIYSNSTFQCSRRLRHLCPHNPEEDV